MLPCGSQLLPLAITALLPGELDDQVTCSLLLASLWAAESLVQRHLHTGYLQSSSWTDSFARAPGPSRPNLSLPPHPLPGILAQPVYLPALESRPSCPLSLCLLPLRPPTPGYLVPYICCICWKAMNAIPYMISLTTSPLIPFPNLRLLRFHLPLKS